MEPSTEVDSCFGEGVLVSTSDKQFKFDDLVINSEVYRRVTTTTKQKLRNEHRFQQVVDGDLLDLDLVLVDLSDVPDQELPTEQKADWQGLDLLILPIKEEEEAGKLSQVLPTSTTELYSASNDQHSELQSDKDDSYRIT